MKNKFCHYTLQIFSPLFDVPNNLYFHDNIYFHNIIQNDMSKVSKGLHAKPRPEWNVLMELIIGTCGGLCQL